MVYTAVKKNVKNVGQKCKTSPAWGLVAVGEERK
jgi:hypothetical protein